MSSNKVGKEGNNADPDREPWEQQAIEAVRGIRYGSVEILIHDGRVVQIERRVKVRFDAADRRLPDGRERESHESRRTDRMPGGTAPPLTGREKTR